MKFIRPLIFFFIIASFSCTNQEILGALGKTGEVLGGEDNALTNTEVIAGLKQALSIGAENSTALTSKEDGFYKNPLIVIPFPEEAIKVKNTLMDIGFENHVNKYEMVMNRAAEEATKEAAVIFVNAITSMSIQDGFNILKGGKGAATDFLKNATRAQLVNSFSPKVETAIETVELGKYWEPLIMKYNQVNALNPFGSGDDINPNLNDYVTNRAIDGLFTMVEKEEDKIREDPAARVTDLLKKVFSQQ